MSGATGAARPLRSQDTRDRILAAAQEVFARDGYERATIRAIADQARIHASMVMRYHGSKEGLFAAAATFDLQLPHLAGVDPATAGRRLVEHFLSRWEGEGSDGQLEILLRASVTHSGARQRLVSIFEDQLTVSLGQLESIDRHEARAALVATQMLGLAFARYTIELPGVAKLDRSIIAACLGRTIQTYLTGPLTSERPAVP